jgi:hypothetical protein
VAEKIKTETGKEVEVEALHYHLISYTNNLIDRRIIKHTQIKAEYEGQGEYVLCLH